jgi:integrase/recombinase XerD
MHTELLYSFKEHLAVLGRSPGTIRHYGDQVRLYLAGLDRDIRAVTRAELEAYIAGLHTYRAEDGRPYTIGTICMKVRALKRFFGFLEARNIIFINPMEFIREPRKDKNLPRDILTVKEMRQLLDQPNLGELTGIRDRTVLELFYSTGLRLEELCRLTIHDADLQGGMLRINQGKGKKDRVVPMGRHAVRFLREYITKVRPRHARRNRQSRSLLVNQLGEPLSKQVVGVMIRGYARAAGIGKKVTAHTFRHTFATQLVKNGAEIVAVQKMLGHADLKTTQGYVRALGLDVKKVHTSCHPREKDQVKQGAIKPEIKRFRPEYARKSHAPGR